MDQPPQHMKISELSHYSNMPVTTIRYYIHEGLLPPSLKTAKTMAYYTQEHLNRLVEIKKLKEEKKISLDAIKDIIGSDDNEEISASEDIGVKRTSTRDEIIKATVELFREKGYDNVTISDIAAGAKVGKGTFYHYFKNKEELFWACVDTIFYDIGKDIPELQTETDALKRLWIRGQHFNPFAGNFIELLSLSRRESFLNSNEVKIKRERAFSNFIEPVQKEIEMIIQQHHLPLKNSLLIAYLLMGAVEYSYYYILNYAKTIDDINEVFWNIFFGYVPSYERESQT